MSIVTGTSSRYWIGGNKSHFKPDAKGKGEYIYIEDAGEVEPGKMWQMSITSSNKTILLLTAINYSKK